MAATRRVKVCDGEVFRKGAGRAWRVAAGGCWSPARGRDARRYSAGRAAAATGSGRGTGAGNRPPAKKRVSAEGARRCS